MSNIYNQISKENRLEEIIDKQDKCLRLSPLFKPLSDNEIENRAIQIVETEQTND